MYCLTPRQRLRAAFALITLSLAAGCGDTMVEEPPQSQTTPPPAAEPPIGVASTTPAVVTPAPPPEPLVKPAAPVGSVPAAPPQVAALDPAPPAPTRALNGLSMPEMETELGRPAAEADRTPAKVWQYRAGDCAVDVYFYLDMARNGFYALHHEARRGATADESCIRVVQEAGRAR